MPIQDNEYNANYLFRRFESSTGTESWPFPRWEQKISIGDSFFFKEKKIAKKQIQEHFVNNLWSQFTFELRLILRTSWNALSVNHVGSQGGDYAGKDSFVLTCNCPHDHTFKKLKVNHWWFINLQMYFSPDDIGFLIGYYFNDGRWCARNNL